VATEAARDGSAAHDSAASVDAAVAADRATVGEDYPSDAEAAADRLSTD
jgi:hypothetical protein